MTTLTPEQEEFLAKLDPKVAKNVRTAAGVRPRRFPLASEGLTRLLGGGIPSGRVTTCYGNYSSGKTLLFQESIGKLWQPQGLKCAWLDIERSWDDQWAEKLGIDNNNIWLSQPKNSADVERATRMYIDGGIDVVVIDSISDIMPSVFYDEKGGLNEQEKRKQTGAQAKAITALINGIHAVNEETAIVLISQTTTSINQTYVEQIPHGGKKTEFGSSIMIKLTSSNSEGQTIKEKIQVGDRLVEKVVGRKVDALLKKSKQGNQFASCKYNVYFKGPHVGIDRVGELVEYGVEVGALSGTNWLTLNSTGEKWNGKPETAKAFRDKPELVERLKKDIHMLETGEVLD